LTINLFQQAVDLLSVQSIGGWNMSHSARFFRLVLLSVILAISLLLYSFLVSFKAAFQVWLYGLAAIVPIVGSFFLRWKYQWNNQKLAFLWAAGLLGFITFEWSLIGMLLDEPTSHFGLSYPLSIAALFGMVTFIVTAIISLLFTMLLHALNDQNTRIGG
jgi:competence protein ComGC